MRKKLLAIIMAAVVATGSVVGSASVAMAAKVNGTATGAELEEDLEYVSYYEDYLRALESRCIEYQEYLSSSTGTGQYALLFELRVLSAYMMYTQFMIKYDNDFGKSIKTNPEVYAQDLSSRIDAFNMNFEDKSPDYKKMTLNDDFDGINHAGEDSANEKAVIAFKKNIVKKIPEYLKELLKGVQDEITDANGNDKEVEAIKNQNSTLIGNVYTVCQFALEAKSDLAAYTPITVADDGSVKHKKYKLEWKGTTVEDAYNSVFKDYPDLFAVAQKVALTEATEEEIEVDLTKPYVENLSDAVVMDGKVEVPKSPKLTLLYYAIMAASSVYVPLQSYAGSSEFQEALKSLTNDKTVQADMVEFYSSIKDMRKPLYKRELDNDGVPAGTAKIMTIQDFIDDIKNGNSGALCTVLGNFIYDPETNSWVYDQSDFRTDDVDGEDYGAISDNSQSSISVTNDSDLDLKVDDSFDPNSNDVDLSAWTAIPSNAPNTFLDDDEGTGAGGGNTTTDEDGSTSTGDENTTTDEDENTTTESAATSTVGGDTTTTTTTDGEQTSGTDAIGKWEVTEDSGVYAYTEITDDTKLSEVMYLYGTDYYRADDNLTAMLMYNVIANSANLQYIKDKGTRYIYVNAFGDIVTDDNLIILPGIANPIMYQSTEAYNPYTAAFMNSYPMCHKTNATFRLTNKKDIGKYIIVKQAENKPKAKVSYYAVKTNSINSIKDVDPIMMRKIHVTFSIDGSTKEKLLKYQRLIFGSETNWSETNPVYCYTPLVTHKTAKVNGILVFPYVPSDDTTDKDVAKAIAQNMYRYLTSDLMTEEEGVTAKFNENYILHYFLINGVAGTSNPKGYSQNTLEQYDKFVKNAPERFLSSLKGLSENIWNFTSEVQGVIGLRDSMQSPILGTILMVCRTNLIFFFLLTTIVMVIIFARMKIDLFQLIVKLFTSLVVSYCCVTLVPTYLPMLFNVVINNVSEDLTYKILALRTEGENVGILDEQLDENGEAKFNSESITLYRAGVLNYEDFVDTMGEERELIGGKIRIINQNAGVFAEGDAIKVNASRLFQTLRIAEHNGEDLGYYRLKAYKTVSNNVDYYMPFYQFTDKFISELNKMNKIYDIPKNVITYSNGVTKENFLVYSFINSTLFLTPGYYEAPVYTEGLSEEETKALKQANQKLAKKLEKTFGKETKASDFLRLSDWIANPSEKMKKTLWCRTMQENGFYDKNWNPDAKKMNALINHVNYQTRKFIFEMDDQIGQLSDETMIKLIALRATVDFNQQISDFGNWVYPFSLNYGDFTLGDAASAVFISEYGKYVSMDFDVVNYIGDSKGWFPLLMMDLLLVLMFIIVYVVQLLMPVMYVLLCITVIAKLVSHGDAKIPVKGFTKCMAVLMAGYTVFALGLALVEKLNGSVISIYAILAICLLLLYLLYAVITSLVFNLADMGNESISAKFDFLSGPRKSGKISNQFVEKMTARRYQRMQRDQANRFAAGSAYSPYSYGSSIDDLYGGYGAGWGNGGYDQWMEPNEPGSWTDEPREEAAAESQQEGSGQEGAGQEEPSATTVEDIETEMANAIREATINLDDIEN